MPSESSGNGAKGVRLKPGQRFNPFGMFNGIFIPGALMRAKGISLGAKVTYGRLARYAGQNGNCYPSVKKLATELGAAVTFTGLVTRTERLAVLAAADVWALPSDTENFGLAVVEALAAGLPVVVAPAVNIASELEENGAGVVCAQSEFGEALQRLIGDPGLRHEFGERGRAYARRYDWSEVAPKLVAMYAATALAGRRELEAA